MAHAMPFTSELGVGEKVYKFTKVKNEQDFLHPERSRNNQEIEAFVKKKLYVGFFNFAFHSKHIFIMVRLCVCFVECLGWFHAFCCFTSDFSMRGIKNHNSDQNSISSETKYKFYRFRI
jgi:hypothetical protein